MSAVPGAPAPFGRMPTGEPVERLEIAGGDLSVAVLGYGAVIQSLNLGGFDRSLVLGLNSLEDYLQHSPHFGAIAGRVANRLSFGKFVIDGAEYRADRNVNGVHSLHGGRVGFGVRNWTFVEHGPDFAVLQLHSADGEMGFPGNLVARCEYRIVPPASLTVTLTAESDAPTLCNLAPHSYFNLEGAGDILSHQLTIHADRITEISEELIPTGNLAAVEGTVFDFREPRLVATGPADGRMRFDHNYCLSDGPRERRHVATLAAQRSGITMSLETTEPGLQFYDGAKINVPVEGLDGRTYGANAGLCLESQHWPDAPNHAAFAGITLRPGETYRHETIYSFARS